MKARKQMKNQALIQEVISQISQRFTPKIPDIKKVRTLSSYGCRASLIAPVVPRQSSTYSRRSTSNE